MQTTYGTSMAVAAEGHIANQESLNLISREVEGAAIGFGKAVKQGTADRGVAAATAAADVFRGITCRDQSVLDGVDFNVGESAQVMTKGVVWVLAGAPVVAGAAVYMVVGTAQAGRFTSVSTSNLPIPDAIFETSAGAAGDLVAIRLQ